MSFLDVQDLALAAAQEDFWPVIARWCSEYDTLLGALGLALAAGGVALLLKRRKVNL
jgi:LPXTG-motif cell wall-anchored protein